MLLSTEGILMTYNKNSPPGGGEFLYTYRGSVVIRTLGADAEVKLLHTFDLLAHVLKGAY